MLSVFLEDSPGVSHEDQGKREGLDEEPRTPAHQHCQPGQPRAVATAVLTQQAPNRGEVGRRGQSVPKVTTARGTLGKFCPFSGHQLLGLNMAGVDRVTCKDPFILQL